MTENNVKIPQIIALILQGLVLAIAVLNVLSQKSILIGMGIQLSGPSMVPLQVYICGICFLIQLIFMFITLKYEGKSRRLIAGIVAAAYCLINITSQWLNIVSNMMIARQGADRLAGYSALTSTISNSTAPFLVVASALFFIALGRYGISKNPETEMYGDQYPPVM